MNVGFSLQSSYCLPMTDVLRLLKDAGFCAVSPLWEQEAALEVTVNDAHRCGLSLQSLHAPHRGLPAMWDPDDTASGPVLKNMLRALQDCADWGIPLLVVHAWGGLNYTFPDTPLHFGNFDALVELSLKRGVGLAFENLEGPEYLTALMSRYAALPSVGLCWDSGHERCYTPTRDHLKEYGDRLVMTHLNDNFGITHPQGQLQGTDDLHLLISDGSADWQQTVNRLQQARRQEILNFELKIRPKGDRCRLDLYSKLPLEEYILRAYAGASRIAAAYFL